MGGLQEDREYNINYDTQEDNYRFQIFKNNLAYINKVNEKAKGPDDIRLKINGFGGLKLEELKELNLVKKYSRLENPKLSQKLQNTDDLKPQNISVDWVKRGAVLPPREQGGSCGSCWAFSAVGALQGLRYITEGILEYLSPQQLVSCLPSKYYDPGATNGCEGSQSFYAFLYTNQEGIETENNDPYVSGETSYIPKCHHKKSDSVFYNDGEHQGYKIIPSGDVQAIKNQIQKQVLSVDVCASYSLDFVFYSSGIFDDKDCGACGDHSMLMTGIYDQEGERPYYMVQNSYLYWGQDGYGKIAITSGDGICGINQLVSYPTAKKFN